MSKSEWFIQETNKELEEHFNDPNYDYRKVLGDRRTQPLRWPTTSHVRRINPATLRIRQVHRPDQMTAGFLNPNKGSQTEATK